MWEVIAREGIRDTVARYNSNGDTGRFGPVMDLFTDDAVMELAGRTYTGRDEILTIFTGAAARDGEGHRPGYVRHMTATHQIDFVDRSHATGRLYFQVLTEIGLDHWGRYLDRYRLVDGTWKFARRQVFVDGQSAGSTFPVHAEPPP
jgi:ketosteroid isomerase-like protein